MDQEAGLSVTQLTPAAAEVTCLAGVQTSFAEASEVTLRKMCGLRLSESTVERTTEASACKTVVNNRLGGSGMRWGSPGSNAVCHLRALFLSERCQWDSFWRDHPN